MKRFHYPHRYALRPEDNAGVRELARSLVLTRLDIVNRRLSEGGPHLVGSRFSLADFYLCFWVAYLDRSTVCSRFPAIGRLYDRVRSRPRAGTHLEATEKAADAYADMLQRHPEGVIA
jgi:glutathione S-transferase